MALVTKTINQLHFEDLEPHRFEDLARQLIYDFRDWANLEATGSGGADDGFDARAREVVYDIELNNEGDEGISQKEERVWLIQCKREKSMPPKKIENYLKDIFNQNKEPLYGLIFIAACDFSKKTRDVFISIAREQGIKEFQIWGKSELEDMLFQPKYDHLLFAYFGISLSIRKRTIKTELRSRIATKRKALKAINNMGHYAVLLRDANDKFYPYSGDVPNFKKDPPWLVLNFKEEEHDGLKFYSKKYMAYLSDDKIHFDFIDSINMEHVWENPWSENHFGVSKINPIEEKWRKIPEQNRAFIEIFRIVPYDNILAIDEDGDNYFRGPHFYISFTPKDGPFSPYYYDVTLYNCILGNDRTEIFPNIKNRIEYFKKLLKD
ncbi:MAG: hypothetical protein NTW65_08520 [Deltaproteobacteria bacterium]|nr:hypothetical protein [Deltaproteobacteria bacterium]